MSGQDKAQLQHDARSYSMQILVISDAMPGRSGDIISSDLKGRQLIMQMP